MSFARAVPVALLLALAPPAVAHADATITVTGTAPHKTLTYTVDDALDHRASAAILNGGLEIWDSIGRPSGCAPSGGGQVYCGPAADFEQVVFTFGAGNDALGMAEDFPLEVSADGGAGNDLLNGGGVGDELAGGSGDDVIDGRGGDDLLVAGAGDDYLRGGLGADSFDGGEGDDDLTAAETPPAADAVISCGPGLDTLTEDDVDDLPNDCETLEPPYLDGDVYITGEALDGNVLGLSLPTNIGGDGEATIQWERCDASGYDCTEIDGAQAATYTLTAADVGLRLRAWYGVENGLGDDWVESDATNIVRSAYVAPPTPRPPTPRPPTSRPTTLSPKPSIHPPYLVIAPLAVARKPSFVIRDGYPVVDTGRSVTCPGVAGGAACRLKVAMVPTGATAHIHGRPSSLGQGSVLVAAATRARVRVPLNLRAYRLLRARRKLALSVTVTVTRPYSAAVRTTFTITVKLPKRR